MNKTTKFGQGERVLTRRERARAAAAWDAEQKRVREESLAVLRARREAERTERLRQRIVELWPLWVGLLLGALGPIIQFAAESLGSWGMILVYPFVELARRPEIQVGPITHLLPSVMLYAQFPIEGLLASAVLKRHVSASGVVFQVMLFHFLGLAELWMLTGTAFNFLRR